MNIHQSQNNVHHMKDKLPQAQTRSRSEDTVDILRSFNSNSQIYQVPSKLMSNVTQLTTATSHALETLETSVNAHNTVVNTTIHTDELSNFTINIDQIRIPITNSIPKFSLSTIPTITIANANATMIMSPYSTTSELLLKTNSVKNLDKNGAPIIRQDNYNAKSNRQAKNIERMKPQNYSHFERLSNINNSITVESATESAYNVPEHYTSDLVFSLASAFVLCICIVSILFYMFKSHNKKRTFWSSSKSKKLVHYSGPRRPMLMSREHRGQSYHFHSNLCQPRVPTLLPSDILLEALQDGGITNETFSTSPSEKSQFPDSSAVFESSVKIEILPIIHAHPIPQVK